MNRPCVLILVAATATCFVGLSSSGDKIQEMEKRWSTEEATPADRLKAGSHVFQLVFSLYVKGPEKGGKIPGIPKHKLQIGVPAMGLGSGKSTVARLFAPIAREDAAPVIDYFQKEQLLAEPLDLTKAPFAMNDVPTPSTYGFVLQGGQNARYLIVVGTAAHAVKHLDGLRAIFAKQGSSNTVTAIETALEVVARDEEANAQKEAQP